MKVTNNIGRTGNVIRNTLWAFVAQLIASLAALFSRKVFLSYLGSELLGVNSLFSDVLQLFSFADLGIGVAIAFSLYKPIAENDKNKIRALLQFYKTIYYTVMFALVIISFIFFLLLPSIKTNIPLNELRLYFIIFQIENIIGYLWAYRESYVIALQQERKLTAISMVYNIIKAIAQIIVLILLGNFIAYLLVGVFCLLIKTHQFLQLWI